MEITAIPFTLNSSAISQRQFNSHITLYKNYVGKVNEITKDLNINELNNNNSNPLRNSANSTYSVYRGLKKAETFALDGVILHEEYFKNMTSEQLNPGERTLAAIERFFGSLDKFLADFTACAKAARGWCVLAYDQRTECLRNILQDAHDDGIICAAYPVIVLDMYEHAYFIDYGTDKESYIKNFISAINWPVIEKRVEKLGL